MFQPFANIDLRSFFFNALILKSIKSFEVCGLNEVVYEAFEGREGKVHQKPRFFDNIRIAQCWHLLETV